MLKEVLTFMSDWVFTNMNVRHLERRVRLEQPEGTRTRKHGSRRCTHMRAQTSHFVSLEGGTGEVARVKVDRKVCKKWKAI